MPTFAKTKADYEAIGVSSHEFVRNKAAWIAARKDRVGVLSKLSNSALDEFELFMRFSTRSGILLCANCTQLSQELGDNTHEFFTLFGVDATLLGTFYPYKCNEGNGVCESYAGWYCTRDGNLPCEGAGS